MFLLWNRGRRKGRGLVVGYYTFKVADRISDGKYIVTGYFYQNIIMYYFTNNVVNIIFINFFIIFVPSSILSVITDDINFVVNFINITEITITIFIGHYQHNFFFFIDNFIVIYQFLVVT